MIMSKRRHVVSVCACFILVTSDAQILLKVHLAKRKENFLITDGAQEVRKQKPFSPLQQMVGLITNWN